jgi:hypothetical protein
MSGVLNQGLRYCEIDKKTGKLRLMYPLLLGMFTCYYFVIEKKADKILQEEGKKKSKAYRELQNSFPYRDERKDFHHGVFSGDALFGYQLKGYEEEDLIDLIKRCSKWLERFKSFGLGDFAPRFEDKYELLRLIGDFIIEFQNVCQIISCFFNDWKVCNAKIYNKHRQELPKNFENSAWMMSEVMWKEDPEKKELFSLFDKINKLRNKIIHNFDELMENGITNFENLVRSGILDLQDFVEGLTGMSGVKFAWFPYPAQVKQSDLKTSI